MTGILYAFGAAILLGVAALFANKGSEQADPKLGAALAFTAYVAWQVYTKRTGLDLVTFVSLEAGDIVKIACLGFVTAMMILCLFLAFSCEDISNVMVLVQFKWALALLIGATFFDVKVKMAELIAIAFCLLGMVIIVAGKGIVPRGVFFGFLSGIFAAVAMLIEEQMITGDMGLGARGFDFIIEMVVLVILWGFAAISGSLGGLSKMSFAHGMVICLAGSLMVAVEYFRVASLNHQTELATNQILRTSLLITTILAAVFKQESSTIKKLVGSLIFITGLELMLLL